MSRKIGRREVRTIKNHALMSRELSDDPLALQLAEDMTEIDRVAVDRWLPWRPLTEPLITKRESSLDFLMNTLTVTRKQQWEVRFIGRRKRRAA